MMKKIIALVLVVIMVVCALAACGGSALKGTWVLDVAGVESGYKFSGSKVEVITAGVSAAGVDYKDNGDGTLTVAGATWKYEIDGNTLKLDVTGTGYAYVEYTKK